MQWMSYCCAEAKADDTEAEDGEKAQDTLWRGRGERASWMVNVMEVNCTCQIFKSVSFFIRIIFKASTLLWGEAWKQGCSKGIELRSMCHQLQRKFTLELESNPAHKCASWATPIFQNNFK